MNKIIVWTNVAGNTVITTPSPSLITRQGGIDQAIAYLQSRLDVIPAEAMNVAVKETDEIPSDWTFRDAWTADLVADMEKARAIHLDKIRAVRDRELSKLDLEFSRAQGRNDLIKAGEIETARQRLRDIPQVFDMSTAQNEADLKSLWPAGLPRP